MYYRAIIYVYTHTQCDHRERASVCVCIIFSRALCVPDQFLLSRHGVVSASRVLTAAVVWRRWCGGSGGRGREDWPNGVGEPDRRRLADTRTMPSRAPHGRATVFLFGIVRVFLRPPSSSSSSYTSHAKIKINNKRERYTIQIL